MSAARVVLPPRVRDGLLAAIVARFPRKSFGYLVSEQDPLTAGDFVLFEANVRNEPAWRRRFEAYGQYFVDNDDAGFVASPHEAWAAQKALWTRGLREIAVFHTHRRHPANLSSVDRDLHLDRFPALWHLIVSLRNPQLPQLRAFAVGRDGVREMRIDTSTEAADG